MRTVKWTDACGYPRYGLVLTDIHDDEVITVSDALTGRPELKNPREVQDVDRFKSIRDDHGDTIFDELERYLQDEFDASMETSRAVNGMAPGKLFSVRHGTSKAWYLVTNVSVVHVTIAWRGFDKSRMRDPMLGLGGKFSRTVIERLVRLSDDLEAGERNV